MQINSYITWLLAGVFYAFQMSMRIMPVIMIDYISSRTSFSSRDLGILAAIYYLGYCLAHIPFGIALDKYNPRYIIPSAILICIIGLKITSNADSEIEILFARFIIGFGSAGAILGAIKTISDFHAKDFGLLLGLTILIGVIGAYYGMKPIGLLLTNLTYEQTLEGLLLFGIMLGSAIFAFYWNPHYSNQSQSRANLLSQSLQNIQLWKIGIYSGLMVGVLSGFGDLWGRHFLQNILLLNDIEANIATTLIFIGLGVFSPIMGYLCKWQFNHNYLIAFLGVVMLASLFILLFLTPNILQIIYLICFILGAASSYQIVSFYIMHKSLTQAKIILPLSLLNMIIMIFGFIFHLMIGFILDSFFIPSGFHMLAYSKEAYQIAFSPLIIGLIIGIFGFLKIKDI